MTREEAIKIVRENMHLSYDEGNTFKALQTLVPELRESEDERIRKRLIEFISDIKRISESRRTSWAVRKDDAEMCNAFLSYLKKQKEQKSLNISAASEWLRKHICHYMNSEYNEFHKCVEYDGSIDKERLINDFEEAMQKEQRPADWKPSEEQIGALNYAYCELFKRENVGHNILSSLQRLIDELRNYFSL